MNSRRFSIRCDTVRCSAFYEPAIRIPLVIRAPGSRPRDTVCSDPVSGVDVFPTLCDLMGLAGPDRVQGQSLLKRWESRESSPARPIFSAQGTPGKNRAMMVRTPEYKYATYDDGGTEFYDLGRDPNELDNRVEDVNYRAIVGKLARQLSDWEHDCAAYSHAG
jgi:arylsulfatase A-like enzyme